MSFCRASCCGSGRWARPEEDDPVRHPLDRRGHLPCPMRIAVMTQAPGKVTNAVRCRPPAPTRQRCRGIRKTSPTSGRGWHESSKRRCELATTFDEPAKAGNDFDEDIATPNPWLSPSTAGSSAVRSDRAGIPVRLVAGRRGRAMSATCTSRHLRTRLEAFRQRARRR